MSYVDPRPTCVCDSECFRGYWAIAFRCVDTGRTRLIEMYPGKELDIKGIATMLSKWRIVTFNGIHYDMPMIMLAMTGADTDELKAASDEIIQQNVKPWEFLDRRGLRIKSIVDHVDLFAVAPGMASLKIYGGRIHTQRMQDLPFSPAMTIETEDQRHVLRSYLQNDLSATVDLYWALKIRLELREVMSDKYGVDLRSKSDPQLAEAVIKHDIEKITGKRLFRPDNAGQATAFRYQTPDFIAFETDVCRDMLAKVQSAWFRLNDYTGALVIPEEITSVKVGPSVYKMGIGGLHSNEKKCSFVADDETAYIDRDILSFYPSLILVLGLYPPHLGQLFLSIYKGIFVERVAAKRAGDKDKSEMFKIVLNGAYGKLGSPYSFLYAPNLLIQTTVTGQLVLLMLIERLTQAGFTVISANTDGVTSKVERSQRDVFNAVVTQWEWDTGFVTEEAEYRALFIKSVNNYIGVYA